MKAILAKIHVAIVDLNPLTKLLATLLLGLSALLFPNPWLGFLIVIFLMLTSALIDLLKSFLKLIFGFGIPLSVMLLFIQGFYSPKNKTYIADFGFAKLGLEGTNYALKIVATLLVFVGAFSLMNKTTSMGKIAAALTQSGLNHKASYLVLASLNVVPQMQRRMKTIKEAQEARGVETKGGLIQRAKAFVPLIGPVVLSSLTDAQERGMTLETRGFGIKGVEHTSYITVSTTKLDRILRVLLVLFFILTMIATIYLRLNAV